ncbi:MAG: hypothetical protein ACR2PF_08900 [Rhizobiaceae bacterium]
MDAIALTVSFERDETVETALAHYAAMRQWHVRLFRFLSLALTPLYQSDGALIPRARDTLVSKIARVPPRLVILASIVAGTLIDPPKPLDSD